MVVFKCKMCGGTIEFNEGDTVGVCDSCGTKQTLPRLDSDRKTNLYDRANHFRRNNEFDKAMGIYESILNEDPSDAEAYWSIVLCRYGIEYVEDPATHKRLPTVNRAQFTSVFDDEDYKSALKYADTLQRTIYEEEAKAINEIQKGILEISSKEEPFDVFICYKETDANGCRTPDSVLATELYHQLTNEGFKVFYSRITLEDKLGTAYEPYIFAALNSAKAMVVLGTRPEYFNAVWVKNEWSRYLALIKTGAKKALIPAYRDMDPYDLPEEFSHLQAQDMSKLGFMQDLIRGIKKIIKSDEPKPQAKEAVLVQQPSNASIAPLLRRAFMFLEDWEWNSANEYCEKVLDIEPENAQAYLGKLMAELHVSKKESLKDCSQPFDQRNNYTKAMRFGNDDLKTLLTDSITYINNRNENDRLTGIYDSAVKAMNAAGSESAYKSAAARFKTVPGFKDADDLAEQCLEYAEACRKDSIYMAALSQMKGEDIRSYQSAINTLRGILGWKNVNELITNCQTKIEEIKAHEESVRLERKRKAEENRIAAEKAAKKRKKTIAIITPIVVACVAFVILLATVIIPNSKYNSAMELYNAGKYDEAISAFEALNGYKDSSTQIELCKTAINDQEYHAAVTLYNNGKYDEAISAFEALNGYKDSSAQIELCKAAIKDQEYYAAVELYNNGKYEEAIALFESLNDYMDSVAQIDACNTAIENQKKEVIYNSAVELYNAGKYSEAITKFSAINDYKDSNTLINECTEALNDQNYNTAISLFNAGNYKEAIRVFETLRGYKDSEKKLAEIKTLYYKELFSKASVGSYVHFGAYEQNNDTSDGKEDIEWLVLAKNGNKMLLISRYELDCQSYNSSRTDVTWETCSLRTWLNGTFINNAFSSDEQAMIQNTTVTADKNPSYSTPPGNNTTDKVFLLSITEAKKYFSSDEARKCALTDYAIAQGAETYSSLTGGKEPCWWWLRSPGIDSYEAAGISNDGSVYNYGVIVDYDLGPVRPALWIEW